MPDALKMSLSLNSNFGPFNIDNCRAGIQRLNQTFPELGLTFRLSLAQCEQWCGQGYGSFKKYDALDAVTTWVIPLFALPANMAFAEFSRSKIPYAGKIFVVSHQLADPIDTIWSLATKLDLGRQLRQHCDSLDMSAFCLKGDKAARAKRDIANVCYCLNDWHDGFTERTNRIFQLLRGPQREGVLREIRVTSRTLALVRVRNILRTSIAIIVYLGATFSSLLRANSTGGLGYAQPHTIALRVLCYFLLLQIILSAAAEGWPQQWIPQLCMKRLGERLDYYDRTFGWNDLGKSEIVPWQGGVYSFQPSKGLLGSRAVPWKKGCGTRSLPEFRSSRHILLLSCAVLSVWVSFSVAFVMSWFTPTVGLGGRGLAESVYVGVWTTNFVLNQWLNRQITNRGKLFHIVWAKDIVITILVLLFFFLPFLGKPPGYCCIGLLTNRSLGWYNSCRSWSAYFSRGAVEAYIDLNLGQVEVQHTWSLYFAGIAGGAAIQGILALTIIGLNLNACKLSWRTDRENLEELCGNEIIAQLYDINEGVEKSKPEPKVSSTTPLL